MINNVSILLVCPLFTGLLLGCGSKGDDTSAEATPHATVSVATSRLGELDNTLTATGSFEVLRDEKIKSTIGGRVEKVFVLEGDRVRKGQVVATIISRESFAAIEGARQLLSKGNSAADTQQAHDALRLAESTAAVARIVAPFSGAVISRFVGEGELVNEGTDVVELVDPNSEYFVANVLIDDIASVHPGQPVRISVPGVAASVLRGKVQAITPATNPNSQSLEVRIGLEAVSPRITTGTFGYAEIRIGKVTSVVLVPRQAIYHDDELDRYYVWRIQGDSMALLTQIGVGLSDSTSVEVTFGLKPGDVVATVGGYGLPDSTRVTVADTSRTR